MHLERAAAYRAAVIAASRQDAVDHGWARAGKPEREMATAATHRIEAEDSQRHLPHLENRLKATDRLDEANEADNHQVPDETTLAAWVESAPGEHASRVQDRASGDAYQKAAETTRSATSSGYPAMGSATDDVQTGARGRASGREFDPESAGGPVQQLDAGKAKITSKGVQEVTAHLRRFTGGSPLEIPEQAMLDRLTAIAAGKTEPTTYDLNFYAHERDEAARYAQLGFGPESGVDLGGPTMYDVWNDVHTAALEDYGISGADLFYPGLGP